MGPPESTPRTGDASSLKESLRSALPTGFNCKIRYVHTPSKPCDPLFSALPGHEPEKTRLANHFLTVSVNPSSLPQSAVKVDARDVISFAVEVLIYTSNRLTTIFVSKVDSTPFIPRVRPSPIKTTVSTFLRWLAEQERRKKPKRKVVISLFARAQSQYLFPGSADDKNKHVLDDRQLIRWWARTLDPIIPHDISDENPGTTYQGYLTVPGYAQTELRSFMPPAVPKSRFSPHWKPGNPLLELGTTRGLPEHAPPRCLLPRFPDDPKARFVDDLDEEIGISQDSQVTVSPSKRKSGKWNSIRDLDRFWEAMEFRQECSSGRLVGFLWLVIAPRADQTDPVDTDVPSASQDSQLSTPSSPSAKELRRKALPAKPENRRKRLTGPIIPRQPRVKSKTSVPLNSSTSTSNNSRSDEIGIITTRDGYDRAMQTLLNLDFSTLSIAARSTAKWIAEVCSTCNLHGDFGVDIAGTGEAQGQAEVPAVAKSSSTVNDLGGMVRKKRKADNNTATGNESVQGDAKDTSSADTPAVNVLAGSMIRKKPKSAVAT